MGSIFSRFYLFFAALFLLLACTQNSRAQTQPTPPNGGDFSNNPNPPKLPTGVLLVKGAWASASDSVTPVPESGNVAKNVYNSSYFRLTYPLSEVWGQRYTGPPPSDSGYYVLAHFEPVDSFKGTVHGTILIGAHDLFFSLTQAKSALDLIHFSQSHLPENYKVEMLPTEVKIAGHSFIHFGYVTPVAGLHWHMLATQIRCHVIQFVFSSPDEKLIESLIQDMDKMKLPDEAGLTVGTGEGGGDVPVCVPNYASGENVLERNDPIFTERRFNPIPVRVIIDKEGKVKHIHFLSAFPDQSKTITDSLFQWRFKPYLRNGKPVEVETGIMFGHTPRPATPAAVNASATASTE